MARWRADAARIVFPITAVGSQKATVELGGKSVMAGSTVGSPARDPIRCTVGQPGVIDATDTAGAAPRG